MGIPLTGKDKLAILTDVQAFIKAENLSIAARDFGRPWGGFFVLDEAQAPEFGKLFFPDVSISSLRISGKLSPKILVVAPQKRLSWQYHHRRAEIWRIIHRKVGVVTSLTDEETGKVELSEGDTIRLVQGQRHRLLGLNDWGVVAEIWQHTDPEHPSDEDDIVRLQDDFGR